MAQRYEGTSTQDVAGQVVQQSERGLIGLFRLIDNDDRTALTAARRKSSAAATKSRWCEPCPSRPFGDLRARHRFPPHLGASAPQERRFSATQLRHCFQNGGVGPLPRHAGRDSNADAHPAREARSVKHRSTVVAPDSLFATDEERLALVSMDSGQHPLDCGNSTSRPTRSGSTGDAPTPVS